MKIELKRKQFLKLLAIIVLSDGYIHFTRKRPSSIRLTTMKYCLDEHRILHKIIKKLGYSAKTTDKNGLTNTEIYSRSLIRQLFTLSPTFKTVPHRENKKKFLLKEQPTISFLFNENSKFKWMALSLWFDFDGSISPSIRVKNKTDRKNNKNYHYYQVQIECEIQISETNPNIIKELSKLLDQLKIKHRIKNDKRNWNNIEGITFSENESVLKFIENYTPFTSVKISSKSPRFSGIKKHDIMMGVQRLLKDNRLSYYYKNKEEADEKKAFLTSLLQKNIEENIQPRGLAAKEGAIP